ncbi:MAG TPA: alcohol dehydrogenase catalytic domain-containing protein, partial [Chitinophagaceae bacterium]|nr:alcohol dehydrogenase catalytic domain-containing protein [Chitinophagaceae bacterium]
MIERMTGMHAITLQGFGGVENFRLEQVPLPSAQDGNILVQIKAVAFNPIDYQIRQGLGERKLLHSPILGREFAGIITGGDLRATGFQKGDSVYGYAGSLGSNGTYAEYISVPAAVLAKIPDGLSFETAAAVPMAGLTALQCVTRLQVPAQASVFVAGGSGGVGAWVLKLLRPAGVERLVTTAGGAASRAALRRLGLGDGQIVDYREPQWVQSALSANDGAPYPYCIDAVGGALSEACARLLSIHGSYADI